MCKHKGILFLCLRTDVRIHAEQPGYRDICQKDILFYIVYCRV